MSATLFTNVWIFDGSGGDRFPGEVLIEGTRITHVARGDQTICCDGAIRVDGAGATLMPGLIESHAHLSFPSSTKRIIRERVIAPEEHLLITAYNAKVYLEHGYTSAYSAGCKGLRFEIALKKEIDGGYLPGPRLIASTFERPAYVEAERKGPEAIMKFIADVAADGAQSIKLLLSGDDAFGKGGSLVVQYTEEEVAAAAQQAKKSGVWLAAHAQAAESVKMAARNGFRVIYHCSYADEEALDLIEARKGDIFVAPAIGIIYAKAYLGEEFGFTPDKVKESGFLEAIELNVRVYSEMRKRGIRILPGGDYGFPWNPIGENARDLELFVKLFGWTPAEALNAATQGGAELIGRAGELGQIKEGCLADVLLVRENPLANLAALRDVNNLLAIMQDGRFFKAPASNPLAPETARVHSLMAA
ncbi:amidohydrolase family protein [Caballeronia sp. DA-9]|uniref:amidohydrolase family protein n=1 Tax=Caballeronia sp. DA-9 TaxID=3436237 RepID=UPI003F671094